MPGLLVDYGGVLTNPLTDTMAAWCSLDDIDPADFARVMAEWLGADFSAGAEVNPVHALERGELAVPDFERRLAERLRTRSGRPVPPGGLLERMFAAFRTDPLMLQALRSARSAGVRTALVSNSWGLDYPRAGWDQLFDLIVISGEVGLRKPDPAIYRYAARGLGLRPEECIFVDDLPPNVRGAAAVGMATVLHKSAETTIAELEHLLDLPLRASPSEGADRVTP
jgi:epoxide hydrolase-like predicted phosphatase